MADRRGPAASLEPLARILGDPRAVPDPDWVRALTGASEHQVSAVYAELLAFRSLFAEVRSVLVGGRRGMYAQIRAPFELYALTRILRPEHIVELGVSSGISSTMFLLALRQNRAGRLHSIDLPTFQRGVTLAADESPVAIPPGRSSGWAVPSTLRAGWELQIGPSQRLLGPTVAALPSVGVFLHDDLHTPEHLAWELRTVRPRLRPGSVVLADNTVWTGSAFPEFARSVGATPIARQGSDLLGFRFPSGAGRPR